MIDPEAPQIAKTIKIGREIDLPGVGGMRLWNDGLFIGEVPDNF